MKNKKSHAGNQEKNQTNKIKKAHTLVDSFSFAVQGIVAATKSERNFRAHLSVALLVLYFAFFYYDFSRLEYCVLIFADCLMLSSELINTSVEELTDHVCPDYHCDAKVVKDEAAAGVLISAIGAAGVGFILLWQPPVIRMIIADMIKYFYVWIPILAFILYFIFGMFKKKSNTYN